MKTLGTLLPIWIILAVTITACGYHNPYVYNGPSKSVYITDWKNNTSELGLTTQMYMALVRWFQKSGSITVTKDKSKADLILAGEFISIHFPGRSFTANGMVIETKMYLHVRYILKEISTGKVLMEVPDQLFTADCAVSTNSVESKTYQQEALTNITEEMAQKIYQRSLVELPKL